jgi:hypothetical protein
MPLKTRISLSAQRIVKEAFQDLERAISTEDRIELKDTTLEDVRKAAYQIEDQLAARQSLRNMRRLMPLFTGLEHYSKSIEILCNGTPYLAWIWSPIKLILKVCEWRHHGCIWSGKLTLSDDTQIAADFIEAFEQIIKAYGRIAESLTRFSFLSHSFSTSTDVHMQQVLAVFYADIVKFHKESYQFVRRSGK